MPITVVQPRRVACRPEYANNDGYHHRCPSTTESYRILHSLMFTFTLIGNIGWKDFRKTGCLVHLTMSTVYGTVVLIFISTNVIRWCLIFNRDDQFGVPFITKLATVTWGLEAVFHSIGFFIAAMSYTRLPEFLFKWDELRCHCVQSTASLKTQTDICTAVIWLLASLYTAFNIYLIFYTHEPDITLYPLTINDECYQVLVMKIINLVVQTYLILAWIAPSAFLFMVSNILAWEFTYNAAKIRVLQGNATTECLETIRKNHQKLCNLVNHADSILSMQIAASFLGSLTLICLTLYEIILGNDVGIWYRYTDMYLLTITGLKILIDCISGARVKQAVSTQHTHMHTHALEHAHAHAPTRC